MNMDTLSKRDIEVELKKLDFNSAKTEYMASWVCGMVLAFGSLYFAEKAVKGWDIPFFVAFIFNFAAMAMFFWWPIKRNLDRSDRELDAAVANINHKYDHKAKARRQLREQAARREASSNKKTPSFTDLGDALEEWKRDPENHGKEPTDEDWRNMLEQQAQISEPLGGT